MARKLTKQNQIMARLLSISIFLVFALLMVLGWRVTDPDFVRSMSSGKADQNVVEQQVENHASQPTANSVTSNTGAHKFSFGTKVKVVGFSIIAIIVAVGLIFIGAEEIGFPVIGVAIIAVLVILLFF